MNITKKLMFFCLAIVVSHASILGVGNNDNDDNYKRAVHYHKKKQYDLAEQYYLMAIECGNSESMNSLGIFYYQQKNYNLAEKYYKIAISNGFASQGNLEQLYNMI